MPPRKGKTLIGLDIDYLADQAGGVHISEEEIDAAFEFFDVDKSGKLTVAGLKDRLGAFYKNLPPKEIKLLLGEGNFTKETLKHLLLNNDLGNYDPTKEAFKAYDPAGTGFIDTGTLRSIFQSLGYGDMSEDDVMVLVETADVDKDGKISLDDFRQMLNFSKDPANDLSKRAPAGTAEAPAAAQPAAELETDGAAAATS